MDIVEKGIEKSVPFFVPEKGGNWDEKKKVRAIRTNGHKDSNGVFKAGHNDWSFNLENAEHVDADRGKWMFIGIICKDITLRMKMESDRKENIYLMRFNIFIITNNSGIP